MSRTSYQGTTYLQSAQCITYLGDLARDLLLMYQCVYNIII